mgnify:CR=1 FL=1
MNCFAVKEILEIGDFMKKRLLKTLLITLFAGSIVTNIVLWDISKTYEKKYTEICNAFGIDVEMSNKEAVQYIIDKVYIEHVLGICTDDDDIILRTP